MTVEEVKRIKKALFIENEQWESMKGQTIYSIHKKFLRYGIDCVVVDEAASNKETVLKEALTSDAILFASTFTRPGEVESVGNLLKGIKEPKLIFGHAMSDSLRPAIERIWNVYELDKFSHHRLFEINDRGIDYDGWCTEIDLSKYSKEVTRLEIEKQQRNKGFKKRCDNVLIKEIRAFGNEWSLLKEGMVVQELDCSSIDPNPRIGIWVMGLTEPVKLLNHGDFDEWEYKDPNCYQLAEEFFRKGNKYGLDTVFMRDVGKNIGIHTGPCKMTDAELWDHCELICGFLGLEKRGNCAYFHRRISEHRKRYVYFRDPAVRGEF